MVKRLISVIFVATLIVAGLNLYGMGNKPIDINEVIIGYLPITADLPLFVAAEKGFFKEQGLNVKLVKMGSSNEAMNALMAGRTDMEGAVGFSSLMSVEAKISGQFKLYTTGVETDKKYTARILVRKDSNIKSVHDLKGKIIGTYSGLTQLLNLKLVLKNFMDPEKDVTIKQVATSLQVPALQSGQFDALFTIDPYGTIALEKGIGKVLIENPRAKYIKIGRASCRERV